MAIFDKQIGDQQHRGRFGNFTQTGTLDISSLEKSKFHHRPQNKGPSIHKIGSSTKNRKLSLLCFKMVDQPPRFMDGKGGLTFPNIEDNTIQSSIAKAFSRYIAHNTKIPNFKFGLNVLRGNGTSFGEMIK